MHPVLAQILKAETSSMTRLRQGEVVEAILMKKMPRAVYFDLGKFGTGIVYGAEFQNAKDILKKANVGDKLSAKIDRMDGAEGCVELSLSEADKQRLWVQVKALEESGEIVKIKISGSNQGGLTADLLGLKAFLPGSQLGADHAISGTETDKQKLADEMKKLIGTEISVKVINVNPRMNKLIVSERESANPTVNLKELLAKYAAGQTIDGVVSGIADFGVFIKFTDNPEIEGLVHISEIDYRIIDNPKEVVKLGEAVKVKIIDIRDGRVFLSLKALKADPWEGAAARFKADQEISGRVYKFNPFGAIIDLDGGIQGLIHISEFGGPDEMKKILSLGEPHKFIVSAVKPEEKRIILKLKK